jgi:hypothetical protein
MGSDKSRDDEIYERGVHDGQKSTLLDQFSHSLTKGYTLNERENAIYNAGYTYGVDHKSDAKDDNPSLEDDRRSGNRRWKPGTGCAHVLRPGRGAPRFSRVHLLRRWGRKGTIEDAEDLLRVLTFLSVSFE